MYNLDWGGRIKNFTFQPGKIVLSWETLSFNGNFLKGFMHILQAQFMNDEHCKKFCVCFSLAFVFTPLPEVIISITLTQLLLFFERSAIVFVQRYTYTIHSLLEFFQQIFLPNTKTLFLPNKHTSNETSNTSDNWIKHEPCVEQRIVASRFTRHRRLLRVRQQFLRAQFCRFTVLLGWLWKSKIQTCQNKYYVILICERTKG
jgi:hypothetical protein